MTSTLGLKTSGAIGVAFGSVGAAATTTGDLAFVCSVGKPVLTLVGVLIWAVLPHGFEVGAGAGTRTTLFAVTLLLSLLSIESFSSDFEFSLRKSKKRQKNNLDLGTGLFGVLGGLW